LAAAHPAANASWWRLACSGRPFAQQELTLAPSQPVQALSLNSPARTQSALAVAAGAVSRVWVLIRFRRLRDRVMSEPGPDGQGTRKSRVIAGGLVRAIYVESNMLLMAI
jgi:hypothetical protein